jgi:hypothetical protein
VPSAAVRTVPTPEEPLAGWKATQTSATRLPSRALVTVPAIVGGTSGVTS